jgi:hypothetical protein
VKRLQAVRPALKKTAPADAAALSQEQIGITLWRLRPSMSEDAGPTISIPGAAGIPASWTPVRVEADHLFTLGDIIRLTVESPRKGYLYVIDRELYSDGSLGDALLIFPTRRTRNGDNSVEAGSPVDIPAWSDRVPYFVLDSRYQRYMGEQLTFLLSPQPLPGLTIEDKPLLIPREKMETWEEEWGTEAYLYEQEGSIGEAQTKVEQQAAQPHNRQLVQAEPVPQTIYQLNVRHGGPFLINLSVKAKRPNK